MIRYIRFIHDYLCYKHQGSESWYSGELPEWAHTTFSLEINLQDDYCEELL